MVVVEKNAVGQKLWNSVNKSNKQGIVDGRNPAPPGMYQTLWILGYLLHQLVNAGFLNHQQYEDKMPNRLDDDWCFILGKKILPTETAFTEMQY